MALTSLPFELLDTIANALDSRRDLAAFACTNSTLYAVAQRSLYRHLSVTANSKSFAVTHVLAENPLLARHVRSFALAIPQGHQIPVEYYQSLSKALAGMHDLESLKLTIDPSVSWVLPGGTFHLFPRLQHFTCLFALDPHVTQFLGKTSGLVHLELGHDLSPDLSITEMHSSWLPQLASFAGSSQSAQVIVPGRPISSISMHSGDLTADVVHTLSKSAAPISFLDATTASLPLPLLEAMAIVLPELQELRLATTYNLWDEWFNTPFIHNIKNALTCMNSLKTAEVSGMLWRWLNKEGRVLANEPRVPVDIHDDHDSSSYFHA
ncbi:hypothetical protein BKA70DRAFT_1557198 [Coprinopsis sp. MPI-PUGE-AT-0042]|nr:hypothetical protein BKA70DRAFT_1557198 [Coprinopsis sp. MPI-PUGE-AT-0042]